MIEEVVAEYGMSKSRPKAVPMSPGTVLVKPGADERLEVERYPYSALVGSLLYIAGCTRPDISHAVGVLTRHMSAPGKEHWKATSEMVADCLTKPLAFEKFRQFRESMNVCKI